MTAVVFCGPTISAEEATCLSGAVAHGPAALGDVYRAVRDGSTVIGVVDGYFERVPAVWHKEILWALSEGALVLGAASMGALRAAELDRFGMEGVGRAYADFAAGRLTDDDEVAVAHADADDGFAPVSEAMIDIRATLRAAADAAVITPGQHDELVAGAKALFYPERTWPIVLAPLSDPDRDRVSRWVRANPMRVKHDDAVALCQRLAELQRSSRRRRAVTPFVPTTFWEFARGQIDGPRASDGATVPTERVHDEMVLAGAARRVHDAIRAGERGGGRRATAGVGTRHADAVRWMADTPGLPRLVDRARHKDETLRRAGLVEVGPSDVDLDAAHLHRWWFECVGDQAIPAEVAPTAAASDVGPVTFGRIVRRERAYRTVLGHEVVDRVLGPGDAAALLRAIRRPGPITCVRRRPPERTDAYYAAVVSGSVADAVASSIFRAPLTAAEAEPLRWSRRLRQAVRRAVGPDAVIEPRHLLLNVMLPGQHVARHRDVPEFRGIDRISTPNWLLLAMGASGLFEEYRAPITTAVVFLGDVGGPLELRPAHTDRAISVEPAHDRAVVFDADRTEHGVPRLGGATRPDWSPADRLRSVGHGRWVVDRGDQVVHHGRWDEVRVSVSWKVWAFRDGCAADRWRSGAVIDRAGAESMIRDDLLRRGIVDQGAGTDIVERAAIDTWLTPAPPRRS